MREEEGDGREEGMRKEGGGKEGKYSDEVYIS